MRKEKRIVSGLLLSFCLYSGARDYVVPVHVSGPINITVGKHQDKDEEKEKKCQRQNSYSGKQIACAAAAGGVVTLLAVFSAYQGWKLWKNYQFQQEHPVVARLGQTIKNKVLAFFAWISKNRKPEPKQKPENSGAPSCEVPSSEDRPSLPIMFDVDEVLIDRRPLSPWAKIGEKFSDVLGKNRVSEFSPSDKIMLSSPLNN